MSSSKQHRLRTLPAVIVLFGAAFLEAGCSCLCPKTLGERGPEPVNILVTWNPELRQIVVFPDTARVCERRQFARWVVIGPGSSLAISFPEGSPFEAGLVEVKTPPESTVAAVKPSSRKEEDLKLVQESGVARPGTAGKRYKYVVSLTLPGVDKPVTLDPYIEVDR